MVMVLRVIFKSQNKGLWKIRNDNVSLLFYNSCLNDGSCFWCNRSQLKSSKNGRSHHVFQIGKMQRYVTQISVMIVKITRQYYKI